MKGKLIVSSILLMFNISSIATPPVISHMIFFGDSLSDVGNNTWVKLDDVVGTPLTNPNAQSSKLIWVNDLVEKKLNQLTYPSSAAHINPLQDNIDYAFADATTINGYLNASWPQNDPPAPSVNPACLQPGPIKDAAGNITSTCVPGLQKQVDLYLNQVQFKPDQNTVFFIWSGANDLLNEYSSLVSALKAKLFLARYYLPTHDALDKINQEVVNNINTAKNKLIDAGVKPEQIYILNLPDLSKTPAVQKNDSWGLWFLFGKQNVIDNLVYISNSFNQKLQQQNADVKYQIPATHYVRIDQLFLDMVSHPGNYQLTNVNESCVANYAMPECRGYLFYDAKHPTAYVNSIIADHIRKLLES